MGGYGLGVLLPVGQQWCHGGQSRRQVADAGLDGGLVVLVGVFVLRDAGMASRSGLLGLMQGRLRLGDTLLQVVAGLLLVVAYAL